jgi:hypothetical protein
MSRDGVAAAFDGSSIEELPESVDRAAVRRIRRVASVLDESIPVPGTGYRIGMDPVLSALPGVGDAVSTAISLYIVAEAARLGVPFTTLVRMLATVTIDAVGGMLPVVGPLFDAVFKANTRNVELLLEELLSDESFGTDPEDDAVVIEVE